MCLRRSHSQPSESFLMMGAESDGAFVIIWFVSRSQQRVELLTSVPSISRPGLDSVTADVTGDVLAQLLEGHLKVSQRFPGLSGMLQLVMSRGARARCLWRAQGTNQHK